MKKNANMKFVAKIYIYIYDSNNADTFLKWKSISVNNIFLKIRLKSQEKGKKGVLVF